MTSKLPKRYFFDIHIDFSGEGSSVFKLMHKKRFWRGEESLFTIDLRGRPDKSQEQEVLDYLTAYAWELKNGKLKN